MRFNKWRRLLTRSKVRRSGNTYTVLASFPKSGNTWVRFILANLLTRHGPHPAPIDFHSVHRVVPEYTPGTPFYPSDTPVLKTHEPYQPSFSSAVVVLRNPWDTLYSYYRYLTGEKKEELLLENLVTDPRRGMDAYIRHAHSYLLSPVRLLLLTYERLQEDPLRETEKLADFLQLAPSQEDMAMAVEKSSFGSMRRIETEKGRKFGDKNFLFTRKGIVGEGLAFMEQNKSVHAHIMQALERSPLLYYLYRDMAR